MKTRIGLMTVCVIAVTALVLTSAYAQPAHQDQPKKDQPQEEQSKETPKAEKPSLPLCPVMDKPIDFGISVMTDDGPVYLCCPRCIAKFKDDPKKYQAKVADQRKALAAMPKVQVACPVSGKPVDPKVFIEQDGKKVFFCGKNCSEDYKKDPAKYAGKLAGCYTYQTKCPGSGEEVSPTASLSIDGGPTVYFCCKNCIAKFEADPAKYCPKLAEQGLRVEPAKVKGGAKGEADKAAKPGDKEEKAEKKGHEGHEGHEHHGGEHNH